MAKQKLNITLPDGTTGVLIVYEDATLEDQVRYIHIINLAF